MFLNLLMAKIGIDFLKLNNTHYIFITYMQKHRNSIFFFSKDTIIYTYTS